MFKASDYFRNEWVSWKLFLAVCICHRTCLTFASFWLVLDRYTRPVDELAGNPTRYTTLQSLIHCNFIYSLHLFVLPSEDSEVCSVCSKNIAQYLLIVKTSSQCEKETITSIMAFVYLIICCEMAWVYRLHQRIVRTQFRLYCGQHL